MSIIIDKNGVKIQDTDIILQEYRDLFVSVFGSDIDTSLQGVTGQFINALVLREVENSTKILELFNGYNIETAEGVFLDYHARIFGITRRQPTKTLVVATFLGEEGLLIPQGFKLIDENGNIFVSDVDSTIKSGTVDVNCYCEVSGSIEISANSLDFYDNKAGLDSVNNNDDGITGAPLESDESFRNRIISSREINSVGLTESLYSALYQLTNNFSLTENKTDTTITVDTIDIPSHSILLCIKDGTEKEIAEILYSKLSAGAGMAGDVVYELDTKYGSKYEIKFQRPTIDDISFKIIVADRKDQISDVVNVIKAETKKYFDSINIIGTTFYTSDFIYHLKEFGIKGIKDITINNGLSYYELTPIKIGSLSLNDIDVEIK